MEYRHSKMSHRGLAAFKNGKYPPRRAAKEIRKRFNLNIRAEDIKSVLPRVEWHHRGMDFRKVWFYNVDITNKQLTRLRHREKYNTAFAEIKRRVYTKSGERIVSKCPVDIMKLGLGLLGVCADISPSRARNCCILINKCLLNNRKPYLKGVKNASKVSNQRLVLSNSRVSVG